MTRLFCSSDPGVEFDLTETIPMRLCLLSLTVLILPLAAADSAEPCVSGLAPGQRPGPYSSVVSVGTERGQSHCFICDTADRPAVLIFARTPSDALGKLARGLDKALTDHKSDQLRAWVTFLNADQVSFDPKVVQWSRRFGLRNVPLTVFEDEGGPPTYRLSRDADVTVLLFTKQKVVTNFAFRSGELNDKGIAEILEIVPALVHSPEPMKKSP
jgi:hypothetical protein